MPAGKGLGIVPSVPTANAGIHPTAVIDPSASIDASSEIGAGAVVGARVEIGAGRIIGPLTYIADGVIIGANCRIHAQVTVSHAVLGNRACFIQARALARTVLALPSGQPALPRCRSLAACSLAMA